jgi:Flp pilus assembly secretin CpaC/tetratricopeptide (TPR) repeat protein
MQPNVRSLRPAFSFAGFGFLFLISSCGVMAPQPASDEPLPDPFEDKVQDSSFVPGEDNAQNDLDATAAKAPREEWVREYGEQVQRIRATNPSTITPSAESMTEPAQEADEDIKQLVQDARVHTQLVEQRLALLVDSFIDEGLLLLEQGDVSAAHEQFAHAYELDPGNPVARNLWAQTGTLMGDDRAELTAVAQNARDLEDVRRGQKRLLVRNHLEQGRKALTANDPETAQQQFEDALAIVRFNPGISDDGITENDVQHLVDNARNEVNRAKEAREAAVVEEARRRQEEYEYAERNRVQLKLEALLRSANTAFLRDEFASAIEELDEVLRISPRNTEALNLRRIATRATYERDAQTIRKEYRDSWVDTFDELEHDSLVPNDLLTFPSIKEWLEVEERGPRTFADTGSTRTPADKAILARLEEIRIPIDFQSADLSEVLEHLQRVSSINFLMSQDVRDEADSNSYDLVDRNNLPMSRILKVLLEDLSIPQMTYAVQDGVVRVITTEESRGDYLLEMYDIRDLTFTPVDHPTKDFNLLPSGTEEESFTDGPEEDDPQPFISEDTLVSLIQENIAPDAWTDDANNSINQMPGTLVVKTTPEIHEQIASLLKNLRRNTLTLVHIETRFIEVEDSFLEDIGVDLRGLPPALGAGLDDFGQPNAGGVGTPSNPAGIGTGIQPGVFYPGVNGDLMGRTQNLFDTVLGQPDVLTGSGGLSLQALFLDNANVQAVIRAVTKYQNSNFVNAPSLTIRSGSRGNIQVLTNRTYVRDFEPEIAQAAVIAQPELGVVRDGIVLDVRAIASADRRFITLELRPTLAELIPDAAGNPLPEAQVSLGTPNANNVTIQLPELKIQRLRTTATIPDGATLLLGGLKTSIEQDLESETPFLADVPLLGSIFKRQGQYTSKRKMLILLTASILAPEEVEPKTGFMR